MLTASLREFLLWCLALNLGVLLLWFAVFALAHDFVYNLHGRWFKLSREKFDAIHYQGMAAYKIAIYFFLLIPYLALLLTA